MNQVAKFRPAKWHAIVLLLTLFAAATNAQTAANWTQKTPQTNPAARYRHAMVYDSAHGQIVMFGGNLGLTDTDETWVWDGSNWIKKFPQTSPPARVGHAMAYDSAHGQVVLFGGQISGNTILNDTWVWDGSNWTQKSPQTSPSARVNHAMAYDSTHGQVVLFGGSTNTLLGDTWVWDGSNWTQRSPQTSPPARAQLAMAYDSTHGQVVLFGGSANTIVGDTWVWDGSNWTQRSPQTSPSARVNHAMAYDSTNDQVVLFGGEFFVQGFMFLGDTWVWDGSNWTQKSPQTSPSARFEHAMAYDSTHGQVVLFGGIVNTTLGDTWVWSAGGGSAPAISAVVTASGFGGFSIVAPGTWVEIYGSNLAASSRTWAGSDFSGNSAPTSLDGVQVTIGGQKAYIDYISSTQVNAQLPSGIGTGPQQVVVSRGSAVSAPVNITVNTAQPGLLAPPSFKIGANQYVVALLPDGVTYILPTGSIAGVSSRPAKPGETIVLYGVGFGTVTPSIAAGQIVTQSNQLTSPLQILFGQTPAQLSYDGLSPGFVGLYQFNVVVPAVANSDLVPLTFNLGGVPGSQTLYTAVRQ